MVEQDARMIASTHFAAGLRMGYRDAMQNMLRFTRKFGVNRTIRLVASAVVNRRLHILEGYKGDATWVLDNIPFTAGNVTSPALPLREEGPHKGP